MAGTSQTKHWVERVALLTVATIAGIGPVLADDADRIQPYSKNPTYWQYQGQPVLLLGGSGSATSWK